MPCNKTITLDLHNLPFRFEEDNIKFKVPKRNCKIIGTTFSKNGKGRSRFLSIRLINGKPNWASVTDTKRNQFIGIEHYAL